MRRDESVHLSRGDVARIRPSPQYEIPNLDDGLMELQRGFTAEDTVLLHIETAFWRGLSQAVPQLAAVCAIVD